jgi:acetyl esterase/lipase
VSSDVLKRVPPLANYQIHYGTGSLQFGDLWLPDFTNEQRVPVVVFVHGGWWKAQRGLEYGGHLCAALRADGIATWSLEYRRVGHEGGGWPGTFQDVAGGFNHLEELARSYPLDLTRVVAVGHSAGGHLAFWLAGHPHIPKESPVYLPQLFVPIKAVVALAGAVDLRMTIDLAGLFTFAHDKQEVINLMGAPPSEAPDRYASGNPGELLPLNIPQFLLQGTADDQIPLKLPLKWAERGRGMGERVTVDIIPGADHLDIVDPQSKSWNRVKVAIVTALG